MDKKLITGETFRDSTILVDGNRYERCVFERCTFQFSGEEGVDFIRCSLSDVRWMFIGPAATTINFLQMLHNGFGPSGKALVENLFRQILQSGHTTTVGQEGATLVAEIPTVTATVPGLVGGTPR